MSEPVNLSTVFQVMHSEPGAQPMSSSEAAGDEVMMGSTHGPNDSQQQSIINTKSTEISSDEDSNEIQYLTTYAGLPADRPDNYPHLIKNDSIYEDFEGVDSLRAADGVVTLLYRYNPHSLDAFLDAEKSSFVFWRKEACTAMHNLMILRRGKTVTLGYIDQDGGPEIGGYCDILVQFEIQEDGRWVPYRRFSPSGPGRGWNDRKSEVQSLGQSLVFTMFDGRQWEESCTAEMGYSTSPAFVERARIGKGPIRFKIQSEFGWPGPNMI